MSDDQDMARILERAAQNAERKVALDSRAQVIEKIEQALRSIYRLHGQDARYPLEEALALLRAEKAGSDEW